MTLGDFAEAVRAYALMTGASATSWGRTMKHNQAVGGVPYSAHRFWLGCDVVYDAPIPETERKEIGKRLGLRVLPEGDHDHIQAFDWSAG